MQIISDDDRKEQVAAAAKPAPLPAPLGPQVNLTDAQQAYLYYARKKNRARANG